MKERAVQSHRRNVRPTRSQTVFSKEQHPEKNVVFRDLRGRLLAEWFSVTFGQNCRWRMTSKVQLFIVEQAGVQMRGRRDEPVWIGGGGLIVEGHDVWDRVKFGWE